MSFSFSMSEHDGMKAEARPSISSPPAARAYRHLFGQPRKECGPRVVSLAMSTIGELGRFRPQLMSFALRRLRNREQAEDAVQETFLAALESIDRFSGDSSLGTWLIGILKHKMIDALRGSSREEPLDYAELFRDDNDPANELARRRALDAVDARLKQLSSCAARVFVLREVIGMEMAEVCRELAISSSNCSVMHHRAKMRLRACPRIRGLAADAL
jgi:RNA polymerase sigma-70 factor, ECF subfamily